MACSLLLVVGYAVMRFAIRWNVSLWYWSDPLCYRKQKWERRPSLWRTPTRSSPSVSSPESTKSVSIAQVVLTRLLAFIGFKATMKCLRNGQSKLIIISNNCPAIRKTQLEYMAILGGSKVLNFDGNNVELGKYSVKTIETRPILLCCLFNRNCCLQNAQSLCALHPGPWRFRHSHSCDQLRS